MRFDAKRKMPGVLAALLVVVVWVSPNTVRAQGAVLDDDEPELKEPEPGTAADAVVKSDYGVGVRLRQVFIPKGLLEFFVEEAASGIRNWGFGIEAIRRKGDFEMALGVEYESLSGEDGLWIDKGDTIPEDEVDLVEYDDFGWITVDTTFTWHTQLHPMVALRYGAGIGLGIMLGDVLRSDYVCDSSVLSLDSCHLRTSPPAVNIREPEDKVPPVFPVLNALVGAQIRPVERAAINIEVGMRSVFYFGITGAMFF
jgi:hypothetical protein